ncbi:hypothetical protein P7K49_000549, partial [Saguinus oedipus]
MPEVAEAAPRAFSRLVLTAAGFSEVPHSDRSAWISGPLSQRLFQSIAAFSASSSWLNEVVGQVITDVHLLSFPILLLHVCKNLLKTFITVFLHLNVAHCTVRAVSRLYTVLGITKDVLNQDDLAKRRFIVQPRATVS